MQKAPPSGRNVASVPGPRRRSLGEESRLSWLCLRPRWASVSPSARAGPKSCLHPGVSTLLNGDDVHKARRCGPGARRAHLCPDPTAGRSGGSGTCPAEGWAAMPRSPGLSPETFVSTPGGRDTAGASFTSCCSPAGLDHPGPPRGQAGRDTRPPGREGASGRGEAGAGLLGLPVGPVWPGADRQGENLQGQGAYLEQQVEDTRDTGGRRASTFRTWMENSLGGDVLVQGAFRPLRHALSGSGAQGARGCGGQAHLSALTASRRT